MLMRMRLPRALAAAALLLAAGARAEEITEKEAVRRFLAESPHGRELEALVRITEAETRGWSQWPTPLAGYSREGAGLTEFLQYEQPLPVSGRLGYRRQAGAAAVNAARAQSSHDRWEQIGDVRAVFYALLAAQEREVVIGAGLGRLEDVIRALRLREQEGEGSTYDRLRAERERSEIEADLSSARVMSAQVRARLASFVAASAGPDTLTALGRLESPSVLPPLSELLERAMAARGDYAAERERQSRFRLEQRAAERLRIPEPSVAAGLKRGDVGSRVASGGFFAVFVPLPVFNRSKTEVARFRAETDRAEARGHILQRRIQAEVTSAHATLELRRRMLEEFRREVQAADRQLEQIVRTAYQEGEVGILELLDAFRVSLKTGLRTLDLMSGAKQAEIELERVVGEPVLHKEVMP